MRQSLFKNLILKSRYTKRISLRKAAKEIGISSATLSRIERGALPDIKSFHKICKWGGFDANKILGL